MSVQKLVDDFFIPDSFPTEVVESTQQEKLLDIFAFDDLIDAYQTAQNDGTTKDRAEARRALKDAYRAALRAAGRSDR
jgi:hypothetical protein